MGRVDHAAGSGRRINGGRKRTVGQSGFAQERTQRHRTEADPWPLQKGSSSDQFLGERDADVLMHDRSESFDGLRKLGWLVGWLAMLAKKVCGGSIKADQ
jgi:hypothetical protein